MVFAADCRGVDSGDSGFRLQGTGDPGDRHFVQSGVRYGKTEFMRPEAVQGSRWERQTGKSGAVGIQPPQ